jgi:transcriptional regulator GlxA family with amidase domain
MHRNVAILIFPEVEVLDFAGPFEVFAVTGELNTETFHTFTVACPEPGRGAETLGSVRARNGLKIVPDFTFENAPAPQILIVPGGAGTRPLLKNPGVLEWIRQQAHQAEIVASVCTGALVLAQAGLLHNLRATTHYENFADLAALAPNTEVVEDVRFTDNGQVLTAAGISAGIDLSLHIVSRLLGEPVATKTARYMEYHWRNDGGATR